VSDQFALTGVAPAALGASLERTPAQEAERLKSVAAQFEALLLGQLLSGMKESMFESEDGESGFGGGPLADSLFSELSLALGRAGGLGLADVLRAPLARAAAESGAAQESTPTPDVLSEPAGAGLGLDPRAWNLVPKSISLEPKAEIPLDSPEKAVPGLILARIKAST
jgi:Rod binding domain-containing protein